MGDKWSASINESGKAKKDTIHAVPDRKVYKDCRHKYCNPHQMADDTNYEDEPMPNTSSEGMNCGLLRKAKIDFWPLRHHNYQIS